MSDESSTVFCTNCQRDIPSCNFQMHVMHCQRNIQLCPKCDEPVPRSELNNHDVEFHSQIKCGDCHMTLESSRLDEHKVNECPKRHQPCKYCDLELKAEEMFEHEEYCGSRTETCEDCRKLVMLKYQQLHVESGHRKMKPDEDQVVVLSDDDDDDEDDYYVLENTRNNDISRRDANARPIRRNRNLRHDMAGAGNQWRHVINLNDELDDYLQNLELDHARSTATVRVNVPRTNRPSSTNSMNWQETTWIPCEFCDVPVLADEIVEHQTGCRPDLLSAPPAMRSQEREEPEEQRNQPESDDDILIPCEFCQQPFALDHFAIHQTACQNNGVAYY